jgi:hypothetical protein
LLKALDAVLPDPRDPLYITHRQIDLLRQRVYGIAQGYEDLNDHETLRHDLVWQTALERTTTLASDSTLCRLSSSGPTAGRPRLSPGAPGQFHRLLCRGAQELILDFDATDDRVHGNQEGRHYHGYYGDLCFLPLYVFCGEQLLVSYLRPSKIGAAHHAWAILKLLVARLRAAWPDVHIIVRGDSGFCRWRMLHWCEWASVDTSSAWRRNPRLEVLGAPLMAEAQQAYAAAPQKQRRFAWIDYAAGIWDRERQVIAKAESAR